MICKVINSTTKIVGYVCSIVLLSFIGIWLLITGVSYFFSFVCLVVILLITLLVIRFIDGVNRRTALFFESLHNNDSMQHYPSVADDPFLDNLHSEMNRVIAQFSKNNRDMEEKRVYYENILRVLTHEIRNSICPIRSLSADLLKHTARYSSEELAEGLDVIHSQAKSLSAFLDSYHRLTHLPDPELKDVDIALLFQKLQRLLCAEPDNDRVCFLLPDNLLLHADPNLLVLALINLIRNALQAITSQSGGVVSVEAYCVEGHICITVTDNGPGIQPELLPAIFTPFFSTKSEGNGIGLSLSLRIMQLHGGELTVKSVPGVQTVFTMHF